MQLMTPSNSQKEILSVCEVNRCIKNLISGSIRLSNLYVKGEISNYKLHSSGHMYFTLKDEESVIKAVMFKSSAIKLKFRPDNGMKIIAKGYVSVFERDGQYQLYIENIEPDGIGGLHIAFEQLKKRLESKGYFSEKRKKELPYLPEKIGVISSPTGAVIKDIINVLTSRFTNFNLVLYPVRVQGSEACHEISKAIRVLNEKKMVDVIILARGGGSLEELWPFNEEIVADEIYKSKIPIISAIGHETDFTIADFVSDKRAPTPSAAAQMVMPEKNWLKTNLESHKVRLSHAILKGLQIKKNRFEMIMNRKIFKQPHELINQKILMLDMLEKHLVLKIKAKFNNSSNVFSILISKLNALSPLLVLSRGYLTGTIIKDKMILKSVNQVKKADKIEINVSDGIIDCIVENIKFQEDRKIK